MRRFGWGQTLAVFTCVLGLGACKAAPQGTVVARVGDVYLTQADLATRISKPFLKKITPAEKQRLVQNWVDEELLYQEARKQNLDQDPEVQARIQKAARGLVVAELLERTYARDAKVDEGDIQAYYDQHREAFQRDQPEIRVQQILVSDRNALNQAMERLHNGDPFAQVARDMSIDASASDGGDLGYFTQDMVDPAFWEACQSAKIGQPTRANTKLGFHVIDVLDRREAGSVRDLADVRDDIRQRILADRRQAQREKLLSDIRSHTTWALHLDKIK